MPEMLFDFWLANLFTFDEKKFLTAWKQISNFISSITEMAFNYSTLETFCLVYF